MFREKHGLIASKSAVHGRAVPSQLTALVAAWSGEGDVADAVWEVGSLYALDGESLQALLDDVDGTRAACRLPSADLHLVRSLALAWSEAALGRYARMTCTDPLTGLATAQHLQTQVVDLSHTRESFAWALVIVEAGGGTSPEAASAVPPDVFEQINLSRVAAVVAREVAAGITVARLSSRRCAALVPREEASGLVTRVDGQVHVHSRANRIWIERLPDDPARAAALIDELCR